MDGGEDLFASTLLGQHQTHHPSHAHTHTHPGLTQGIPSQSLSSLAGHQTPSGLAQLPLQEQSHQSHQSHLQQHAHQPHLPSLSALPSLPSQNYQSSYAQHQYTQPGQPDQPEPYQQDAHHQNTTYSQNQTQPAQDPAYIYTTHPDSASSYLTAPPTLPSSTSTPVLPSSRSAPLYSHAAYDRSLGLNTPTKRPADHLTLSSSGRTKRTKLTNEERANVLEIRRRRACLRCKMLKIQCSRDGPCNPCRASAKRGYERKVLSFCFCVRTRFADVDFYQRVDAMPWLGAPLHGPGSAPTSAPKDEIPASVQRLMDRVMPPAEPATPDSEFEETLLRWLATATDTDALKSAHGQSIVAILYGRIGASAALRKAVDDTLPGDFQTFLFATSLVHTGWLPAKHDQVSRRDLCVAGHVAGSRILQRLDRVLTPQFLSKCDKATHRALLLLVFGTILGVSYSTRLTSSPAFPHELLGSAMRHSPTLWLMLKEHVSQMLAHHLIFLGSTLGVKLDTSSEQRVIETAVNRWHKPERSLWAPLPPGLDASADIAMTLGLRSLDAMGSLGELDGGLLAGAAAIPRAMPQESVLLQDPAATNDAALPSVIVPVTFSEEDLLRNMPAMSANDNAAGDDANTQSTAQGQEQPLPPPTHDYTLDSNPASYFSMTDEELAGLLSGPTPPKPTLDRLDDVSHPSGAHDDAEKADEADDADESHDDADVDESHDGDDDNAGSDAPPTSPPYVDKPPPPSRRAMGPDAIVDGSARLKKRSVWVVRPHTVTSGDAHQTVNVHARFRVYEGQSLGLFV